MPKSKNNKKANSNDIISTISKRLTELSHKLIEMFKPQPNMTLDIKPEEVSNNDNQTIWIFNKLD